MQNGYPPTPYQTPPQQAPVANVPPQGYPQAAPPSALPVAYGGTVPPAVEPQQTPAASIPPQGYPQAAPPSAPPVAYGGTVPPAVEPQQAPVASVPPQGYPQAVPPSAPPVAYGGNVPPAVEPQQTPVASVPPQGYPQVVPPSAPPVAYGGTVPPAVEPQQAPAVSVPPQGYPQAAPPVAYGGNVPLAVEPQQAPAASVPPQGYPQVTPSVPPMGPPPGYPPYPGMGQGYPAPYGAYPMPAQPGWYAAPVYAPPYVPGEKPLRDPRQKGATRTMNRMCLLLLAQFALSLFWQFPLQMLLALVGVDIFQNSLGYQWLSGVLVPLATALPFVAYLAFRKDDPADYLKFEKVGFSGGLLCVLGGLAVTLLGNYPATFVSNFFGSFGYESASSYVGGGESLQVVLLDIAITAVLVPFMEEFAFRGVVLSALRKYGIGFSIVASALIFGMAHMDFSTVVFAFVAGLVFGFLYAKTNNLWLPVIIHSLNNLIAVLGSHGEFLFGDMAYFVNNLLMLVPLGVGLVALVLLLVFKRGMFIGPRSPRYDGPAQPLGAGESAASIVRAPMFWVVVGLMALYTLSLFFAL